MKFNYVARIRFLIVIIAAVAVLFCARLFFIQVIRHDYYSEQANRQYLSPSTSLFNRGSIFFSHKDGRLFSAATIKTGFLLAINPKQINNPETVYQKLAAIVPNLDHTDFLKKANRRSDPYEEIINHLDQAAADRIKALKEKGVYIYKEKWRYYPADSLGAHVIGLLGYRGDDYGGRYGLEKKFDDVLSRDKSLTFVNFFAELFSGLGSKLMSGEQRGAGDLVLTIEPSVQSYLEREIAQAKDQWGAEAAGAVIMDPRNGEVLALASLPTFDPNKRQTNVQYLNNPIVESVFEMGSIVKPLTMAAALDAGRVTAKTTYNDQGSLTINGKKIANFDGRGRGVVPMQEVLSQSLNTGSVFVMRSLGQNLYKKYLYNYGIKEKTGIELPDEISGITTNLEKNPREVEFATASFGQGVAWTPIGITRALASLGNGGMLVKPHVIKNIRYETRLNEEVKPVADRQILKPETSKEITRMLVEVVDKALAGGKVKLPHYSIAAKTGTAQMAGAGGYAEGRYLHSFFGYFPASAPRFIVFLYLVNPQGVRYSSETLTTPFTNLSRYLINYYEVPPDR